ncbi:SpoIIAA-like [Mesonia phycicola]|uniref:SpoIIAA-like n=1 Tax=Mesonia phycicola TaxID=579105 RepID=A0A1M6GF26_9FLAO|nr:STAS/SEC14 domain-containing protein [Mesonia phycicola]SHJ08564.1 SpoIIAA-like [Mesonia phycicola]
MISLESKGKTIYTIAEGKLDKDDYKQLIPFLERKIDYEDNLNWYFEMKNFNGWTSKAIWNDIQLDIEYSNHLKKIAMVGDQEWEKWLSKLIKPFNLAEIKYFSNQQKKEAQNWVEE